MKENAVTCKDFIIRQSFSHKDLPSQIYEYTSILLQYYYIITKKKKINMEAGEDQL